MPKGAGSNAAPDGSGDVTHLLGRWGKGDRSALEQLTPLVYDDLLRLARRRLRQEYGDCTLEPNALVHEAYLRLADQTQLSAENRLHFYAIAANTMRRVLIEHARKRKAQKRGAGIRVTLLTDMNGIERPAPDFLAVEEALQRLSEIDKRKSQAIELKFFGGMTVEEISLFLGVSVATVGRDLRLGQAWIRRDMSAHKYNDAD